MENTAVIDSMIEMKKKSKAHWDAVNDYRNYKRGVMSSWSENHSLDECLKLWSSLETFVETANIY